MGSVYGPSVIGQDKYEHLQKGGDVYGPSVVGKPTPQITDITTLTAPAVTGFLEGIKDVDLLKRYLELEESNSRYAGGRVMVLERIRDMIASIQ